MMSDEDLYLKATNEVDSDKRDEALWAKSMALHDGDEKKAKYEYIRSKVKIFAEENKIEIESFSVKEESSNEILEDKFDSSDDQESEFTNNKYGIIQRNDKFYYKDNAYENFQDAVNYAELVEYKTNQTKDEKIDDAKKENIFLKLLNGNISLAKTFWGYTIGVNFLIGIFLGVFSLNGNLLAYEFSIGFIFL